MNQQNVGTKPSFTEEWAVFEVKNVHRSLGILESGLLHVVASVVGFFPSVYFWSEFPKTFFWHSRSGSCLCVHSVIWSQASRMKPVPLFTICEGSGSFRSNDLEDTLWRVEGWKPQIKDWKRTRFIFLRDERLKGEWTAGKGRGSHNLGKKSEGILHRRELELKLQQSRE